MNFRPLILDEAVSRYGKIEEGIWEDEQKWMAVFTVPNTIFPFLINSATKNPTKHIYLNRDLAEPLATAFNNVIQRSLIIELNTFDGCFNIRDVRGEPGKESCHSYGLAIDFNAATNKLGTEGDIDRELVKCFTDVGFAWGGNFTRKDPMHFSWAWE
jgi:hypothetical protein